MDVWLPPVAEEGEWLFIADDGTMRQEIDGDHEASTDDACQHSYVSGTSTQHNVNAKGGCVIEVYEAKACEKCGVTVTGNWTNTTETDKCPHTNRSK